MIPRSLLFGPAEVTGCRISPDGRHLSWLAPSNGVQNLWLAPATHPTAGAPLTADTGRGIQAYAWADRDRIVYQQDRDGDENWRLHAVAIATGQVIDLTPLDAVNARVYATSPDLPGRIAVGLNDRDPRWHDVYIVDAATGVRELVFQNDARLFGYVFDRRLVPRLALRAETEGRTIVTLRDGIVTSWRAVAAEDELTTWLVGLDRAGDTLYWVGAPDRDTAALYAHRLATGDGEVLAEHAGADIADVVCDAVTGVPIAACAEHLARTWIGCGPGREDLERVIAELGPGIEVIDQTADGRTWLIARDTPEEPVAYHRVERPAQTTRLWSSRPALAAHSLVPMRAAVRPARDGLPLTTYVSTPTGQGPWPLVLWVHGGPWRRDSHHFNVMHQWLANRGYAVLSVNFRGSTGLGKRFVNAGDLEWGRRMHDDLLDAIDSVVAEGIADPARVAIAGGSFGGYAALVGMTFTPEVFACGVSICGPANLETSQAGKPAYWAAVTEMRARRIGDPRTAEGRALLAERSPVHRAAAIRRPLLVAHGANDPRVRRTESDQIVEAAQRNGVAVTYLVFRDEGHGLVRPANRLAFYAVMEAFLAQHLGGRAESIGSAVDDANLELVAGSY